MSEMVERVADVIAAELVEDRDDREVHRRIARAVIKAMRMPTAEMRKADEAMASYWDLSTAPPRLAIRLGAHVGLSYSDMIEEALK